MAHVEPRELFSAGRLLARSKAKYMKAILLAFAPVEAPGLGTIGVTEHGILMLDWEFFRQVAAQSGSPEQAAKRAGGLLVHEAFHVLLKHGKRSKKRKDARRSNMADDMSFNDAVIDMGLELPEGELRGCFAADYGWERGLPSDVYYERLGQLPPQPGQGGSGGQDPQPGGAPGAPQAGAGTPGGTPGQGAPAKGPPGAGQAADGATPKAGGGWCGSCAGRAMPGEPPGTTPGARSKGDLERIARQVARAVQEEASSGRGTVPGFLRRWADELLTPPEVPWEQELGHACRNAMAWRPNCVDHKYDAPSRRQWGVGFGPGKPVLPRFRMPVPNVAVIVDTSGSMGTEQLSKAISETAGILRAVGANVTFVTCDATVHGVTKVKSAKEALANLKGGGGTSMQPAIEAVMRLLPRPEVMVCITDLYIGHPGPQPRGCKMIWVGVGEHQGTDPPWGKVIRVKNTKKEKKAS
jgi:predicted metal-dependent peptidase